MVVVEEEEEKEDEGERRKRKRRRTMRQEGCYQKCQVPMLNRREWLRESLRICCEKDMCFPRGGVCVGGEGGGRGGEMVEIVQRLRLWWWWW